MTEVIDKIKAFKTSTGTIIDASDTEEITAVKCIYCGTLHDIESDTFLTFKGNVYIGTSGGIIGNNFDEDGRLFSATVLCRNKVCVEQMMRICDVKRTA